MPCSICKIVNKDFVSHCCVFLMNILYNDKQRVGFDANHTKFIRNSVQLIVCREYRMFFEKHLVHSVYVCIYVCLFVCMYVFVCVFACVYVCMCVFMCACMCIFV